jgi:hypothetical protein
MLIAVMLLATMLNVIIVGVVMLSVLALNLVTLSFIVPSVVIIRDDISIKSSNVKININVVCNLISVSSEHFNLGIN